MTPSAVIGNVEARIAAARDVGNTLGHGRQTTQRHVEVIEASGEPGGENAAASLANRVGAAQERDGGPGVFPDHSSPRPSAPVRARRIGTSPSVK